MVTTLILVAIGLLTTTLSSRNLMTTDGATQTNVIDSESHPLCNRNDILLHRNKGKTRTTLLTTADEDESFLQPQCMLLHHYVLEDVVKCLNKLSFKRAQH